MESIIAKHLSPEMHPVALLTSDERPDGAIQPKEGKYVCIMTMFAQVAAHAKTAVFDRNTYGCPGASVGLGLGSVYPSVMGGLDVFEAFFSKGIDSAKDPDAYAEAVKHAPKHMVNKLTVGERFHASPGKARRWMTEELPEYDFKEEFRVLKPLSEVTDGEVPASVVFVVNPLQLSALITLAGSVRDGLLDIMAPQGAACQMIGAYVFQQAAADIPRPVLGLTDLAARKHIRKTIPPEYLTFAMPWELFLQYEEAAEDGIFSSPLWEDML
ncbi:DUF169 domain-containing protein [Desulfovibrio sp. JC010]|uniref:DUF169 domain-containing protein n=1 Tax=Desulfovibrio sp. JC010 TaxID=2593641 RepID=UPI0013D3CF72|nr:DUF169 domain-containing protein [Desulfovibrio sp. JC010]NDV26609.1 hypothetical protein [Desulfovibrio sp. JC010]